MPVLSTLLAALLLANPAIDTFPGGENAGLVARHLQNSHPSNGSGEVAFEPGTKVVAIDAPGIFRADPSLRLYQTTLLTHHFEYPKVEVAVAAWTVDGHLRTAECFSPTYNDSSAEFIARLRGLRAESLEERERLANEICEVFRRITYLGKVTNAQMAGSEFTADLWHGHLRWRRIGIVYSASGRVMTIDETNPKERQ